MKRVLIASGSDAFLMQLPPEVKASDDFQVVVATDGYQAVEALDEYPDSLLVTDTNIPRTGCLDIIAHLTRHQSSIPVIAIPDIGKPWFERRLGRRELLYYLVNPRRGGSLSDAIGVGFDMRKHESSYRGLTVSSLLPLIELEQKTGRMTIRSEKEGKGYLYLRDGVLIDAHYHNLGGEQAARKLATWDRIAVDFSDLPKRRSRIKVVSNLMELAGATWVQQAVDPGDKTAGGEDRNTTVTAGRKSTKLAAAGLLKKYVDEFRLIKGFLGMAVTDSHGNLLASYGAGDKRALNQSLDECSEFLAAIPDLPGPETSGQMAALSLHTRTGTVFVTKTRIQGVPCRLIALTRAGVSLAFATIHLQNIFLRMMVDPDS